LYRGDLPKCRAKHSIFSGKEMSQKNNFHALEDSFDLAIRQQMKNG
jgi:hypothetical protein